MSNHRPSGGRHKRRRRSSFRRRGNSAVNSMRSGLYTPREGKKYDVKSGGPKKV
jgi:hypothetical protein